MSRPLRILLVFFVAVFLLLNALAAIHAWRFTHFTSEASPAPDFKTLSTTQKLTLALTGIPVARPALTRQPDTIAEHMTIPGKTSLDCWLIRTQRARGTAILFHGYKATKSELLDKAALFRRLGYNTLLVDFPGSGASGGIQTTIGYKEAADVVYCAAYVRQHLTGQLILCGHSMGAAAIMRAVAVDSLRADALILEAPFATMYETVCTRFRMMGIPEFPAAGLLTFWGGALNGFWAFGHNPEDYAAHISCPVQLALGGQDDRVSREETDRIFQRLPGYRELRVYPNAGHADLLGGYAHKREMDIRSFLQTALP